MGDHDKERLRIRLRDQRVRMLMMNPSGECVLEVSLAVEPAGWSSGQPPAAERHPRPRRLNGDSGSDEVLGGVGDDFITADDLYADTLDGGDGTDRGYVDSWDSWTSVEEVFRY